MRSVHLDLAVADQPADVVYGILSDFRRYPELAPAVRSVDILSRDGTTSTSAWEVTFRAGIMRWVEEDTFDPEARRIEFRQLQGDAALFDGTWTCNDTDGGTLVTFTARVDMG